MPEIRVVFFSDRDGTAPALEWMDERDERVQNKCIERIERLARFGYELRRPLADTLRDGIHELRLRVGNVPHRLLYFFHGGKAVISHGLRKEREVPDIEIERAIRRKKAYARNPTTHTYREAKS